MKVRFNSTEAYLAELERDHPKMVRLTNCFGFSRSSRVNNTREVVVVATHLSSDKQLVRLDRYVGSLWSLDTDGRADKTMKAAEAIHKQITAAAKALKIEVRAGVIEP